MRDELRLFVAIELSFEVLRQVEGIQSALRTRASDVKWVQPENFHLTLKFLGATPAGKVQAIRAKLEQVAREFQPFGLEVRGAGAFPTIRRVRVVWLGVEGETATLSRLADQVDQAMVPFGFPRETRPFSAHLTLGRRREPRPDAGLQQALEERKDARAGRFSVGQFVLMRSDLHPKGPTYTRIQAFALGSPSAG